MACCESFPTLTPWTAAKPQVLHCLSLIGPILLGAPERFQLCNNSHRLSSKQELKVQIKYLQQEGVLLCNRTNICWFRQGRWDSIDRR